MGVYSDLPNYLVEAIVRFEDRVESLAMNHFLLGGTNRKSYEQLCKEYDTAKANLVKCINRYAGK